MLSLNCVSFFYISMHILCIILMLYIEYIIINVIIIVTQKVLAMITVRPRPCDNLNTTKICSTPDNH